MEQGGWTATSASRHASRHHGVSAPPAYSQSQEYAQVPQYPSNVAPLSTTASVYPETPVYSQHYQSTAEDVSQQQQQQRVSEPRSCFSCAVVSTLLFYLLLYIALFTLVGCLMTGVFSNTKTERIYINATTSYNISKSVLTALALPATGSGAIVLQHDAELINATLSGLTTVDDIDAITLQAEHGKFTTSLSSPTADITSLDTTSLVSSNVTVSNALTTLKLTVTNVSTLNALNAQTIDTDTLTADDVHTDTLEATSGTITTLEAHVLASDTAVITDLNSTSFFTAEAGIGVLSADIAKFTYQTAIDAVIGNLNTTTLNGNTFPTDIPADSVLATSSAHHINAIQLLAHQILAANASGALGGRVFSINEFTITTTQTYTPNPNIVQVCVQMVGGGGGSGSCTAPTGGVVFCSGSGGGGEFAEKCFTPAQVNGGVLVTIGAGGVVGAPGNTNGGNGGTTSFGALLTAVGGSGGLSYGGGAIMFTVQCFPSAGGSGGLGGGIRFQGGFGNQGQMQNISGTIYTFEWPSGGDSMLGQGGAIYGSPILPGFGGGGGGVTCASQLTSGYAGGAGLVALREYILT